MNKKVFSDTISFKQYSKELSSFKVMTKQIEDNIKQKYLNPNTTDQERKKLKNDLIEGHLRYAMQVAHKYSGLGMELEDVIAEANLGLAKAVDTFDFSRNIKFITHASYYIRGEILNALNNNARVIRLPMNIMHKLNREYKELKMNGTELSDEMSNMPTTTNLHKIIGEDSTLLDILKNKNSKQSDYDYEFDNLVEYVLSRLDERSAKIISLLFGLKGEQKDMKEIADEFKLNVETIRNIKNKALEKIKARIELTF